MKYTLLFFFLIALSCNPVKKKTEPKKEIKVEENVFEKKDMKNDKRKEKAKTHSNLLLVLKNPNNVTDAKALIENSSLIWEDLIIDKNTLKVASIKVPIERKEFWIERLKLSNVFTLIDENTEEKIAYIKHTSENTFVKISKTHCSGDCPVYDVTLFKDGKLVFNGIENVNIKGLKEFTVSEKKMKKIEEMFHKTSFGTYLDNYVDKSIMDYPSTFITYNDKQIEIKLWKNVPEELAFAYETLEDVLYENKLLE